MKEEYFLASALNVTEKTAIACHEWMGKGQEFEADEAAVEAMRKSLNEIEMDGRIVIGEGERDRAPMLYIGEKLGKNHSSPEIDIAVDPLEGTTLCAEANFGSICVLAMAEKGNLLHAPDTYMEKIAIGLKHPEYIIDLDDSPKQNLTNLAKAKSCNIEDLRVVVLKRPRHQELIAKIREAGARLRLISDGDILPILEAGLGEQVDIYMGTGGAPEGVLAAASLAAMGGQMMGRLVFADEEEKSRARKMGIMDYGKKYRLDELAKGKIVFSASAVTDSNLLKGVKKMKNGSFVVNSLITCTATRSIRIVKNLGL